MINIVVPVVEGETMEDLTNEQRIVPRGYRVVVTREPSMIVWGKQLEIVTVWFGTEILGRHLAYR